VILDFAQNISVEINLIAFLWGYNYYICGTHRWYRLPSIRASLSGGPALSLYPETRYSGSYFLCSSSVLTKKFWGSTWNLDKIASFRNLSYSLLTTYPIIARYWCVVKWRQNNNTFFHWLYGPLEPWPLISHFHDHFTDGRTPCTSDHLVSRPLPEHRTTQTQKKTHTYTKHPLLVWDSNPRSRVSELAKTVYALDGWANVTG
jgi:hypothetical protein